MIKKIIFIVLFCSIGLSENSMGLSGNLDFSKWPDHIREQLPDKLKTIYTQNTFYFALGHYMAKNLDINLDAEYLYEKLVSGIKTNKHISHINAFYYGIFEYLIIKDFLTKSNLDRILQNSDLSCSYTGIELYKNFQDFDSKKSNYESLLLKYTDSYDDNFNYKGFAAKYISVFNDLMLNLHATILKESGLIEDFVFLKTNSSQYFPSDRMIITLTTDKMNSVAVDTIEIADEEKLIEQFTDLTHTDSTIVLDTVVQEFDEYKTFTAYPVIDPFHISLNLASVNINIKSPFDIDLSLLEYSPYLLNIYENYNLKGSKLLHPFDLIFVGGFPDDPLTEDDESEINHAIPGDFTHLILYLGRLSDGTPIGAEMTTTIDAKNYSTRLIKLLEGSDDPFDSSNYDLPLVTVDIYKYKNVNARRLNSYDLNRVSDRGSEIYSRVMSDIYNSFPYQYQFVWSGNLEDKNIYLVDDGLANGAACTDYWLAVFEEMADVCIKGARVDSTDLIDYFTNDPVGKTIKIPENFNPFSFEVYVKNIIGFLGFNIINPEPHIFSCDNSEETGSEETGIAIPDKLYNSDNLVEIDFIHFE